jgi:hypothetical protein
MKTNLVRCALASIPLLFASTFQADAQNRFHLGHDHYWYVERYQDCRCFWQTEATARRDIGLLDWRASHMQRLSALKMCLRAEDIASGAPAASPIDPALVVGKARYCDPY